MKAAQSEFAVHAVAMAPPRSVSHGRPWPTYAVEAGVALALRVNPVGARCSSPRSRARVAHWGALPVQTQATMALVEVRVPVE